MPRNIEVITIYPYLLFAAIKELVIGFTSKFYHFQLVKNMAGIEVRTHIHSNKSNNRCWFVDEEHYCPIMICNSPTSQWLLFDWLIYCRCKFKLHLQAYFGHIGNYKICR